MVQPIYVPNTRGNNETTVGTVIKLVIIAALLYFVINMGLPMIQEQFGGSTISVNQ